MSCTRSSPRSILASACPTLCMAAFWLGARRMPSMALSSVPNRLVPGRSVMLSPSAGRPWMSRLRPGMPVTVTVSGSSARKSGRRPGGGTAPGGRVVVGVLAAPGAGGGAPGPRGGGGGLGGGKGGGGGGGGRGGGGVVGDGVAGAAGAGGGARACGAEGDAVVVAGDQARGGGCDGAGGQLPACRDGADGCGVDPVAPGVEHEGRVAVQRCGNARPGAGALAGLAGKAVVGGAAQRPGKGRLRAAQRAEQRNAVGVLAVGHLQQLLAQTLQLVGDGCAVFGLEAGVAGADHQCAKVLQQVDGIAQRGFAQRDGVALGGQCALVALNARQAVERAFGLRGGHRVVAGPHHALARGQVLLQVGQLALARAQVAQRAVVHIGRAKAGNVIAHVDLPGLPDVQRAMPCSSASKMFCATCSTFDEAWKACWYWISLAASSSRFTPEMALRSRSRLAAMVRDRSAANLALWVRVPIWAMACA